jgi:hypothetical protein
MAILTASRALDFDSAATLVNEFRLRHGDLLPLLICSASMCNSILDTYAELIEEDPLLWILAIVLLVALIANHGRTRV